MILKLNHCFKSNGGFVRQEKEAGSSRQDVCLGEPAYCAQWWSCIGESLLQTGLPHLVGQEGDGDGDGDSDGDSDGDDDGYGDGDIDCEEG